jgi:hypothetical protein
MHIVISLMSDRPPPPEWQAGDPPGCIHQVKASPNAWKLQIRGRPLITFPFNDHGGTSEGAYAAAAAERYRIGQETETLKNRYRYIVDITTNKGWIEVELTQGKVGRIDVGDLPRMINWEYSWYALLNNGIFYMATSYKPDGTKATYFFHNLITGFDFVDHLDGDGLNDRRDNLVKSSYKLNAQNHAINSNNTTGVCGVQFDKSQRRFRATWLENGKDKKASFKASAYGSWRAFVLATFFRHWKEIELGITVRPQRPRRVDAEDKEGKNGDGDEPPEMKAREDGLPADIHPFLEALAGFKQSTRAHSTMAEPEVDAPPEGEVEDHPALLPPPMPSFNDDGVEEAPERKEEHEEDELPSAIREILKRPVPPVVLEDDDAAAEPPTKKQRRLDDFFKPH